MSTAARFALLTALFAVGCGRPPARSYYTLTYPAERGDFATPHDVTIRVREVDLRESYRRTELVFRPDVHEIRYDRRQRWSERPQKMITSLVTDHLRASGLVSRVTDAVGQIAPDYTLAGEVEAIEQVVAGDTAYARLAMNWRLLRAKDDAVVWTWRFDRREPVGKPDKPGTVRATVRTLSALLDREFDRALVDLDQYLNTPETPRLMALDQRPSDVEGPSEGPGEGEGEGSDVKLVHWTQDDPLNTLPQLQADETPMGVGFGAIFVPALSESDQEPTVAVYGLDGGGLITEGHMGQRIVLPPGGYEVRFGTGTGEQQLSRKVRVDDGRATVVPPEWAALRVDVVDEQFVPFRGTYELIRMDNREEYGPGFGADEQQGEKVRVWVLPPGLYKIIRSGGTYRDRTDFATVRLLAGETSRVTLVLDPDTGEFKGAGEVDPYEEAPEDQTWTLRGVVGGSVSFNDTDFVGEQTGRTIGTSLFFDGAAIYRRDAHLWHTRIELEEEQSRGPADKAFINTADRLYLHTIYTYVLVPWFGPYARVGAETKLLPRYQYFEDEQWHRKLDSDGNIKETFRSDQVGLGGTLAPLQLREGMGGNFRVLRKRSVELDLRLGFGGRQTLANGLYTATGSTAEDIDPDREGDETINLYTPVEDSYVTGIEGTVVGFARLVRWVTVSTEFDGLLAFEQDDSSFEWRNQISLRLASFISLNYRFNMAYLPTIEDQTQTEHDVQLRFSYTLF